MNTENIVFFDSIDPRDTALHGGKGAFLGFLTQHCSAYATIPYGFVITSNAYTQFCITANIQELIKSTYSHAIAARSNMHQAEFLAYIEHAALLLQQAIINTPVIPALASEISQAYRELCKKTHTKTIQVAVRSSALVEDMLGNSCAGQHASFLNISGEAEVYQAYIQVIASLFTPRAFFYYLEHAYTQQQIGMACCVQAMAWQDTSETVVSGVTFTMHPETGNTDCITISAVAGSGESLVSGERTPAQWYLNKKLAKNGSGIVSSSTTSNKQLLQNSDITIIARSALGIEQTYQNFFANTHVLDIEWVYSPTLQKVSCVQVRPAYNNTHHTANTKNQYSYATYTLQPAKKQSKKLLGEGQAIGRCIVYGKVLKVNSLKQLQDTTIDLRDYCIVTPMTNPDWIPYISKSCALITLQGGRTCHAAIVSRERGIPAIVGIMNSDLLHDGMVVTIDCSSGEHGYIWEGKLAYTKQEYQVDIAKKPATKLMLILSDPTQAWSAAALPSDGVGLMRLEFLISQIGVHPSCVYSKIPDTLNKKICIKAGIKNITELREWYIQQLVNGIVAMSGAFYPRPVIVRFGDFKSNEYRLLLGGDIFEPCEENPMIGLRGAARYRHPLFKEAFALECEAIHRVHVEHGLKNCHVMVPFVRTTQEARDVLNLIQSYGLNKEALGLQIYMMVEVPSNVINFAGFEPLFDGFSIGSNDLTQLVLGVDRDSGSMADAYDVRDTAVCTMIEQVITAAQRAGKPIGICGQAPSDYPQFAIWLIQLEITSIAMQQDSILPFLSRYSAKE
jgi:pyruvate,water dikinase